MLLVVLVMGVIGWWHGREMYRLGREMGRLDVRKEQATAELVQQRRHLRVVK